MPLSVYIFAVKKKMLTCRESSSFMAFCEFNVEECDDRMHVVISSALEMEGSCELQVSFLDCVDVYFLEPKIAVYIIMLYGNHPRK